MRKDLAGMLSGLAPGGARQKQKAARARLSASGSA